MQSLWDDRMAGACASPLALRAYTSRLIGGNRELVLCGGGNTSLKTAETLYVKGSGADLSAVDERHFTALDLGALRGLLRDRLLDDDTVTARISACKLDTDSPRPSIETLMHAALPFSHVEHAHADAVLAVANVEDCEQACAHAFGDLAPVVPYRHSGVALARACQAVFESRCSARSIGLVLAFHGVVAFGNSARESYGNLIRLVTLAEDWLRKREAWDIPGAASPSVPAHGPAGAAKAEALRAAASHCAGFPLAMTVVTSPVTLAFAQRADLAEVALQGPPTPQHAVYTKRLPLIDGDVTAFGDRYRGYLAAELGASGASIDTAPRILLDPDFGFCALGASPALAADAAEIYRHGIAIMSRAAAHGHYRSASAHDIARAELEYGGFERRIITSLKQDLIRRQP